MRWNTWPHLKGIATRKPSNLKYPCLLVGIIDLSHRSWQSRSLFCLSFWAIAKNLLIKWDPSAYASGWQLERWKLKKGWRKRRHSERSASGAKNPGDPSAYVSGWQCDGHSDPEPKPWAYAKGLRRGRIPSLFHHSDFSIIECLHSGQPFVAFIPNNERMSSRNLFSIGNFRRQNFFLTKISFFMV